VKEPPLETRLVRAELLEEAQHNAEALALLEPIVKALPFPSPLGCTARFLQGKALRKERQLAKAVATLQPVIDKCGGEKNLRVRALYLAAQADGFRDTNEAVGFYKTLAHDYPDHGLADDALFFAADIEERAGDDDAAQKVLETLVDTPAYRDGDYRADGLFHLFWLLRSKGEWEKGLSVLERLSSEYGATRSAEAERAEYWRGKALIELKRPADAASVFDSLARSHPTSYYAMQARARLASIDPVKAKLLAADQAKRTPPAPLAFALGSLGGEPHLDAALALHRLGLELDATDELMAIPNDRLRAEPDGMRLLVLLLSRMGQPAIAQQIARSTLAQQLAGPLTPETMQTWLAAFPLAFREPLQKACEKAKLEPDLFQALIREESALDPKALSWAGAVGLSQLMLPTAKEVASHLGMKASNITKDALVDPELNLTLGSTYIAGLLKRFNGNPALALAAYNAGPGSVNKWLGMNGQEDLDAFVEEIPVEETRHYVKRVLQSFNIYQLLYQQSAQATLPLSCVKG
jgi:soluble lytic murein transglycosylase